MPFISQSIYFINKIKRRKLGFWIVDLPFYTIRSPWWSSSCASIQHRDWVFFKTPLNQEKPSPKVYKSSIQLFVHIHSNPLEPRIYQIYIYQIPDIVCIATLYFYRALTRTKISFTVIGEAYIFRGRGEARVSLGASLSLGEKKNGRALFLARGK